MKFEKLNESSEKGRTIFLCGLITGVSLLIIFNLFLTKAKYKVVDSAKLVNSTINYSSADLNVIAMYKNDGETEELIKEVPEGYYDIDNERSYCKVPDNETHIKDKITYDGEEVNIKITKKGTKCYVYFIPAAAKTLADIGIKEEIKEGKTEFTGIATKEDKGLFSGEDDYGETYYFRGQVDNNWVKIGEEYWRIIRINGNGTIRLIYNGQTTEISGEGTLAKTNIAFNTNNDDNKYVGFMYGKEYPSTNYETAHKNEEKSTILEAIENWYINEPTGQDLNKYEKYLDGATGFCGDRSKVGITTTDNNREFPNLGYGTSSTIYGAYHRILDNNDTTQWGKTQKPTFKCGIDPSKGDTLNEEYLKRDLYTTKSEKGIGNGVLTYPIGLITADEVVFTGGFAGTSSSTYWLNTNVSYWTISPSSMWINGYDDVLVVLANGYLRGYNVNNTNHSVRPIINLKADTPFISGGNGSSSNPFTVKLT